MSVQAARRLRKRMTPAEVLLWTRLRELRALGHHFRRQAPLNGYVLDFVCFASRLAIEVDGHTHASSAGRDAIRDAKLAALHIRTIRVNNRDVLTNIRGVTEMILTELGRD